MSVTAETGEDGGGITIGSRMNRSKCVQQVKSGDRAAGAMGLTLLMSEDQGRSASAVDDAGGKNTKHASVPVRIVEDDATGREGLVRITHGGELGLDGGKGLG